MECRCEEVQLPDGSRRLNLCGLHSNYERQVIRELKKQFDAALAEVDKQVLKEMDKDLSKAGGMKLGAKMVSDRMRWY